MNKQLHDRRVAILVADGFEQIELESPKHALEEAGARVDIVSPNAGRVKGWRHTQWGDEFPVDTPLDKANPDNYDCLVLPGGQMNPDNLRLEPKAIDFIKRFGEAHKTIAAVCHGPWTLIDAGLVKGKRMTSYPSIKNDMKNAGANWVDERVVVDDNFITSRKPDDLDAFNNAIVEALSTATAPR